MEINPLEQRTEVVNEKIEIMVGEMKRAKRRNNDQMLAETITQLYERLSAKIKSMEDIRVELDEVFEALAPLRQLEEEFRGKE